jgi:hypothetical protein
MSGWGDVEYTKEQWFLWAQKLDPLPWEWPNFDHYIKQYRLAGPAYSPSMTSEARRSYRQVLRDDLEHSLGIFKREKRALLPERQAPHYDLYYRLHDSVVRSAVAWEEKMDYLQIIRDDLLNSLDTEKRMMKEEELERKYQAQAAAATAETRRRADLAASQLANQQRIDALDASQVAPKAATLVQFTALRADVSVLQASLAAVESTCDQLSVCLAALSARDAAVVTVKAEEIAVQEDRTITPDLTILESADLASLDTVSFSPVTEMSDSPAAQSREPRVLLPVEFQDPGVVRPEFPPAPAVLSPIFRRGAGGRAVADELKRSQRLAAKPMKRWDLAEVGNGASQRGGRRRVFDPGRLDLKHVRGGSL